MISIARPLVHHGHKQKCIIAAFGALIVFTSGCDWLQPPRHELEEKLAQIGGPEVLRPACQSLMSKLLRDDYITDIPEDNPIYALRPQYISLIASGGVEFYNIQMSGGFYHAGYLITVDPSSEISALPFSNWRKKNVGDGVFTYEE